MITIVKLINIYHLAVTVVCACACVWYLRSTLDNFKATLFFYWFILFHFFETPDWLQTLNSWSSCPHLLRAEVIGRHHHTRIKVRYELQSPCETVYLKLPSCSVLSLAVGPKIYTSLETVLTGVTREWRNGRHTDTCTEKLGLSVLHALTEMCQWTQNSMCLLSTTEWGLLCAAGWGGGLAHLGRRSQREQSQAVNILEEEAVGESFCIHSAKVLPFLSTQLNQRKALTRIYTCPGKGFATPNGLRRWHWPCSSQ